CGVVHLPARSQTASVGTSGWDDHVAGAPVLGATISTMTLSAPQPTRVVSEVVGGSARPTVLLGDTPRTERPFGCFTRWNDHPAYSQAGGTLSSAWRVCVPAMEAIRSGLSSVLPGAGKERSTRSLPLIESMVGGRP